MEYDKILHPKHNKTRSSTPRPVLTTPDAPRMLRLNLRPTKHQVLPDVKPGNLVYNILGNEDVCVVDDSDSQSQAYQDSILSEEKLGWVSIGRDKYNLQIWPDISQCEKSLLRLINLPIFSITNMPQITSSGSIPAKVENFTTELRNACIQLQHLLQYSMYGPIALVAILRHYEYFTQNKVAETMKNLVDAHVGDYEGLGKEMRKIRRELREINEKFPGKMQFGIIEIDLTPAKAEIQRNGEFLLQGLLTELASEYIGLLNYSNSLFVRIKSDLKRVPKTVEELKIISDYIETNSDITNFSEITSILSQTKTIFSLFTEFQYQLDPVYEGKYWETRTWESSLQLIRVKTIARLESAKPGFVDQVIFDAKTLKSVGGKIQTSISQFEAFSEITKADEYADEAANVTKTLQEATNKADLINSRERILGMKVTDFGQFECMGRDFERFQELWALASMWNHAWNEWNYRSFHTIEAETVKEKYRQGVEGVSELQAKMKDLEGPMKVVRVLKEQMGKFKGYAQVVMSLRQPAIQDRHIQHLLEVLHVHATPDSVTLLDLSTANILDNSVLIEEICHEARNEYEIELVLKKAESEVQNFELSLETDPDFSDLRYVTGLRQAEDTVQELQVTLSFLNSSSKYVSFFRQKIEKLAVSLTISLQVIRDIADFQEQWLRIYPLLQLSDLSLSLKNHSELIDDLQAFYNRQIHLIHSTQSLTVTSDAKIKSFMEASERCEFIWKLIKRNLDEKMEVYLRLLLLSHSEIMRFFVSIARGHDVEITSVFPGIEKINIMQPELNTVLHGSEPISITPPVTLPWNNTNKIRQEAWLQDLEIALKTAFHRQIAEIVTDWEHGNTEWWKKSADSQILVITEWILFSKIMGESGKNPSEKVRELIGKLKEWLKAIIAEITPVCGTTDKKALVMFKKPGSVEAKITTRMHLEKVALQILNQIQFLHIFESSPHFTPQDFLYKSQFHFSPNTDFSRISVSFFTSTHQFGFEWAPFPLSLSILTPVTERCMLNLALVLKHSEFGLVHSTTCSNQTETIKEMAVMCGRLLQIWTVSRTTQLAAVTQVIRGSVGIGAWMCFEEIHTLEEEVMNALAHYMVKIKAGAENCRSEIEMEGRNIVIAQGFAMWGTSTASKMAFPARFSYCCRTFSLRKPNIALYIEARLYVLGFTSAREIGQKLTRALWMWSEGDSAITTLMSLPQHRVSSLRVANLIIDAMVKLLDSHVFSDINYLLQNACRRVLGLGLNSTEAVALDECLTTAFHATCNDTILGVLHPEKQVLKAEFEKYGLSVGEESERKFRHMLLYLTENSHKVMLITGNVAVGKSTLVKMVIEFYRDSSHTTYSVPILSGQVSSLYMYHIIQACVSSLPVTKFPHISLLPQAAFSPNDIIYLDTEVITTDGLLAVARSELYLQKELRIEVPKTLKVIVETENLENVSPNLVSESCLMHFPDDMFPDSHLFLSSLFTPCPSLIKTSLSSLFSLHFDFIFTLFETCKPAIPLSRRSVILSLSNWISLLLGPETEVTPRLTSLKIEAKSRFINFISDRGETVEESEVEAAWVLAVVGSMGNMVEDRQRMGRGISDMCADDSFAKGLKRHIKGDDGVYNVVYSFARKEWLEWENASTCYLNPATETVFVPTLSVLRLQYWTQQAVFMRKNSLVLGPHQSGKSIVWDEILRQRVAEDFASVIPINVLYSSTCDAVQSEVERMMDQYRPRHFGALGGRHHYIFLEDLNLDIAHLYDLLRFAVQYKGWYKRDAYSTLSDSTFCLAHSYSPHKFREPNYRALRHFFILFKEEYTDQELLTIFNAFNPSQSQQFLSLYSELHREVVELEATCQHSTLSNFVNAMRWGRDCDHWTSMLQRYFPYLVSANSADSALFLPPFLLTNTTNSTPYLPVSQDNFPVFLSIFTTLLEKLESKSTETTQNLTKSNFSTHLYHFSQLIDDFSRNIHSIILTKSSLFPLKSLISMSCEYTNRHLVEINLFDMTSELATSMAEREGHYLPTEVKFALKQTIDFALKGEKSTFLITIDDKSNINSPIFRSFMEICCDVVLGKSLKTYSITRKAHKMHYDLYPDQVLQLQRDTIQKNINFCFVLRSNLPPFDRLTPGNPMETLKHTYRCVFNMCRVVNYEEQMVPASFKSLCNSLISAENRELDVFQTTLNTQIDEFVWSKMRFLANSLQQREDNEIKKELTLITKALSRVKQMEMELEKSEYLLVMQKNIEELRENLENAKQEYILKIKFQDENLGILLQNEKKEFELEHEEKKRRLGWAVSQFIDSIPALIERPSLYQLILLGGLQRAMGLTEEVFPFEDPGLYSVHCKPVLERLRGKGQEGVRRVGGMEAGSLPDLRVHLDEVRGSPGSQGPLYELIVALCEYRESGLLLEAHKQQWNKGELVKSANTKRKIEEGLKLITTLQQQLEDSEERLQSGLMLKQKYLRFLHELKNSQKEWMERSTVLVSALRETKGNSLLKAGMFALGLSLSSDQRAVLKSQLQSALSHLQIPFSFPLQTAKKHQIKLPGFIRNSVKSCEWIWKLGLPYPVFVDEVEVTEKIVSEKELTVLRYAVDVRVDVTLEMCVEKGKAVLVVSPTENMLQVLQPLLRWRYARSLETTHNLEIHEVPVSLGRKKVKVHPDFRLYISLPHLPSEAVARISTVISLRTQDLDTWKSALLLRLGHSYPLPPSSDITTVINMRTLKAFAECQFESIYTSNLQSILRTWQTETQIKPQISDSPVKNRVNSSIISLPELYSELLTAAFELQRLLNRLQFGRWKVSNKVFERLIVQSCEEQIKLAGLPTDSQVSLYKDPILYRLLVRLMWSLPMKYQSGLMITYSISRIAETELAERTLDMMIQGLKWRYGESEEEIRGKYESLKRIWQDYPQEMEIDGKDFKHFISRDTYTPAIFPESLDPCSRSILISWFRPDLLRSHTKSLLLLSLGSRFSSLPDPNPVLISQLSPCNLPICLLYTHRNPLPHLYQSAHLLHVTVTHFIPMNSMKSANGTESKVQSALKALSKARNRKEWLVFEGFEILEKSQIEVFSLQMREILSGEEGCEEFRLWFLFPKKTKLEGDWRLLTENSTRVVFPEAETIRERLLSSPYFPSPDIYESLISNTRSHYEKHAQITLLRSQSRKVTRIMTTKPVIPQRNLSTTLQAGGVLSAQSEYTVREFYRFNGCLLTAALELRGRFDREKRLEAGWKERNSCLNEVIEMSIANHTEYPVNKELILTYFLLISTNWTSHDFLTALNLSKHIFFTSDSHLKFTSTYTTTQYPLYQLTSPQPYIQLLHDLPRNDHLYLIGLSNSLNRRYFQRQGCEIGSILSQFRSETRINMVEILKKFTIKLNILQQNLSIETCEKLEFDAIYEKISSEKVKGFSYFFVPDRYRAADFQLKILTTPPQLNQILDVLNRANYRHFAVFIANLVKKFDRLIGFLQYRTNQIAIKDYKMLQKLRKERISGKWRKFGPYLLRNASIASNYIEKLTIPVLYEAGIVRLSQVMDPNSFLLSLFRALALLKHVDIAKGQVELREFRGDLEPLSVLVTDLMLVNASLRGGFVQDSESERPWRFPVCSFTVISAVLENTENNEIIINYHSSNGEKVVRPARYEPDIAEIMHFAGNFPHTDSIENSETRGIPENNAFNRVVCPVFSSENARFEALFYSEEPQSHWSKRAIRVDLP